METTRSFDNQSFTSKKTSFDFFSSFTLLLKDFETVFHFYLSQDSFKELSDQHDCPDYTRELESTLRSLALYENGYNQVKKELRTLNSYVYRDFSKMQETESDFCLPGDPVSPVLALKRKEAKESPDSSEQKVLV